MAARCWINNFVSCSSRNLYSLRCNSRAFTSVQPKSLTRNLCTKTLSELLGTSEDVKLTVSSTDSRVDPEQDDDHDEKSLNFHLENAVGVQPGYHPYEKSQTVDGKGNVFIDRKRHPHERGNTNVSMRTTKIDPVEHKACDLFQYYAISADTVAALNIDNILRKEFVAMMKTLNEYSLMIRKPALECLSLFKSNTSKKSPSIAAKVLLYGQDGCGKSSTLVNVIHACHSMNWMIICPVRHYLWNNYFQEVEMSSHKTGRIDLPKEGVEFLMSIKRMNAQVFSIFGEQMRTNDTYSWSKREQTLPNTTIEELIDFGIERPKYSCDVVGALLKEIRIYGTKWPTPVLLAVDGVNSFFSPTKIVTDRLKGTTLPAAKISLIHNLLKFVSQEWKNGCKLLVADQRSNPPGPTSESYTPKFLLGEDGFNAINPCIPIEVEKYNDEEMDNTFHYLIERGWIQNEAYRRSHHARKELVFLSDRNPQYLYNVLRVV